MIDTTAAPAPSPRRRRLLRLGVAFLALLVIGWFARNFLVRKGLEAAVTETTGFPFTVGSFDLGLFDARIDVAGMDLRNPPGFEDPRCLRIPRLAADLGFWSLFGRTLHVEECVLDVDEVVVVRDAAGETNLDRLKSLGGGKGKSKGEPKAKEGPPAEGGAHAKRKPFKWRCDRLELTLRRVIFVDYSRVKDGKPSVTEYDVKVDHEEFRDIDGPEKILRLVVLRVLQRTKITLGSVSADSLTEGLGGVAGNLAGVAGGLSGAVEGGVKGVEKALDGILGGGRKDERPKKKR